MRSMGEEIEHARQMPKGVFAPLTHVTPYIYRIELGRRW